MTTKAKYKSDAFEAIHSSASALRKVGAIDKATMRSFDESCLTMPSEIKPAQIKKLREANHVSQPVFARYLNTSKSTVEKWEAAQRHGTQIARHSAEAWLAGAFITTLGLILHKTSYEEDATQLG